MSCPAKSDPPPLTAYAGCNTDKDIATAVKKTAPATKNPFGLLFFVVVVVVVVAFVSIFFETNILLFFDDDEEGPPAIITSIKSFVDVWGIQFVQIEYNGLFCWVLLLWRDSDNDDDGDVFGRKACVVFMPCSEMSVTTTTTTTTNVKKLQQQEVKIFIVILLLLCLSLSLSSLLFDCTSACCDFNLQTLTCCNFSNSGCAVIYDI
jgi:hypothetical protein